MEEDYVANVRNNCWKERQTSEWLNTPTEQACIVSAAHFSFVFITLMLFSCLSHPETDLLYAAKVYRDDRMRKKAELMTMDNCRELDRLNSLFRGG